MKYLLLFLLFFSSVFASIGKVSAVVGDAKIERGNKNIVVKIGIPLFEKDIIRTKKNAKVQLIFKDNTIVTIGKNSALDINTYLYDKKNPKNSKTDLNFFKGAFKTITGKIGKINREKFKLRTKSASIGIRGTIILGNQSVIACTQGGISVESAGITVEVDANELTKVEENKAPSKAENITNNDLNSLEESLEPLDESSSESSNTEEEESSSSDESETNENSSSDDESENSEESTETENSESTENSETQNDNSDNSDNPDDENSISSNTLKTEEALNTDVESAEEEAAKIAAQKQAEEQAVFVKKTEEVKTATATINTIKTEITQTQTQTQETLKDLPSTESVTTYQTNATQTLETANTEVSTAVNNLKDDLGLTESSSQSTQSFFSFSFFSSSSVSSVSSTSSETTSEKTALEKAEELKVDAQNKFNEINSFRNLQDVDVNNLALSSAKTKVDLAKELLDKSKIQLDLAKQALKDANTAGISSSFISNIQTNVDEAQAAYDSVNEAYTIANNLYENKVQALADIETSYINALKGLNQAKLNVEIITIKDSLEIIKSSQKSAITYKDEITTSNNKITSGINTLSSQSQTSSLKTSTASAKDTTNSSITTAVLELQSSTDNEITDDALSNIINLFNQTSGNTDLLNESTALKSDIVTSDNLAALTSAKTELGKATTALANSEAEYQKALDNKTSLETALALAKTLESNSEISELETKLTQEVTNNYNLANDAYKQAQSEHSNAQALYDDKQNAYDEANDSYANAQEAVNDALVLGKLLDLIKFMDSGSDNKSIALTEKTNTLAFKTEINTIINTLPTDEELVTKDNNALATLGSTLDSIDSAINILANASDNESVDANNISLLNSNASSQLSTNETLLAEAQNFKNSVDNEYTNSLNAAESKLNSAKTHKDNTKQALDNAKQALINLNGSFESNEDNYDSNVSDTLKTSLIAKLNNDISEAQAAFDEADDAYVLAENELNDKRTTLNNFANHSIELAQDAVSKAQDLGKLSDMLGYMDSANKSNASATVSKNSAINAKDLVLSKISTLPSSEEIQTEENTASSALSSTRTSVTSAIAAVNAASTSETVNADDVGNISMSANNLKSSNTAVLENAQVFKTKVTEGTYKTTLDEASVKVSEALLAKNSAKTAKVSAELAMNNMNTALELFTAEDLGNITIDGGNESTNEVDMDNGEITLNESIIFTEELLNKLKDKLLAEYNSAKSAYEDADEAYELAKVNYDNKNESLNTAATNSVNNAQTAVNETNLLEDLSDLLTSLENTKEAKINVLVEKAKVVDAKNETVSANTSATTANSNILAFKTDAADAKAASLAASTASTSASSTANNEETLDVQIAYSAKIAIDKVALAKNKADQASAAATNASTQYDNLVSFTNTMNSELSKSLTAKDTAYTNYQTAIAQLAIAKAKKIEIDAVSNTDASSAAVTAVAKAQALHDLALQSYNDANQLYTDTKQIVDDLDITTYLANAETKKNKANSDATDAQAAYNTALVEAVKADTSSKQASLRVKGIMLALNTKQVASDTTESNLGLANKLFELSGVKTNEILVPSAIGAYLGHTQIGAFKEELSSINPLYLVQADNLQEYFVGYSDSSNSDKTLFTYGVDTNNNFDASKINVYKNFKTLKVNTDGTKVLSNDNTLAYYNPVTKSFTTFSKDVFTEGAKSFTAGDAETFNTQINTFNFNSSFTVSSVDITESNGDNKFLGSVEQGLTQTSQNNTLTLDSVDGQSSFVSTKTSDDMSASFLDSQIDFEPLEASRSMSGRVVLLTNSGTHAGTRHENIEMTISKDSNNNVHIVADAKYTNGTTIKRYGGYVNDQKAYYINSDIFGVKVEEPTPSEKGFLIAVPDGGYNEADEFVMYDENDNPLTSNDDSSWGYWSGKNSFNDGNGIVSINPLATWVAGVKTSTAYMDGLINGANQSLEFNGKVLGTIGYRDSILMDSTNKVQINFDIGGGSKNMTGNMQFKSATSNLYNVDLAVSSDNITNSSFTGGFKPAGNPDAATSGYIKGEYYGGSTLKSIGGTFQVDQHGATANGVFKATKK